MGVDVTVTVNTIGGPPRRRNDRVVRKPGEWQEDYSTFGESLMKWRPWGTYVYNDNDGEWYAGFNPEMYFYYTTGDGQWHKDHGTLTNIQLVVDEDTPHRQTERREGIEIRDGAAKIWDLTFPVPFRTDHTYNTYITKRYGYWADEGWPGESEIWSRRLYDDRWNLVPEPPRTRLTLPDDPEFALPPVPRR
ncbi:hypothetical protein [Saccharothrix sp. HUAS TT1]|uniref:hypothetical protein n=1 Tax=unclassified Saccharothrix TaxID=2593673 RepID=UPI00345C137A